MHSFYSFHWLRPFTGLAVLFGVLNSRAQETLPVASLTFASALQRIAENNPALAVQRRNERAAAALAEQAGLRPNPSLGVSLENFAGTGRMRGVESLEATVQASQTFERGGKRDKRIAAASQERDIAAAEYTVRQSELLAAAAIAYTETLASQQRLALAEGPLNLARETLAAVDARVKAGAASYSESARARAAAASARAEYARSEAKLTAARSALASLWGGVPAEVGKLRGHIRVPENMPVEEDFIAGLTQHPRFSLQQAFIAGRRALLELEQSKAVSDFIVGGGVRFLREGSDATFVTNVSMPLPFRNKNQGNIRAAREYLAGAEESVRVVEVELRVAFHAAWQDLIAAHATAKNLRHDSLPAMEEAHATVQHAYRGGQLPLIDVLDAQRELLVLRRELLDAETAYAIALTRVEALTAPNFSATASLLSPE